MTEMRTPLSSDRARELLARIAQRDPDLVELLHLMDLGHATTQRALYLASIGIGTSDMARTLPLDRVAVVLNGLAAREKGLQEAMFRMAATAAEAYARGNDIGDVGYVVLH